MPILRGLLRVSEVAKTAKGNEYWKIEVDGDKMNVFDASTFKILQECDGHEVMCEFKQEGKFKNFVSLKLAEGEAAPPLAEQKKEATQGYKQAITPNDPTRDSIEAQVALKAATEIAVAHINKGTQVNISDICGWVGDFRAVMKEPVGLAGSAVPARDVSAQQSPPLPDFSECKSLMGKSQVLNDYRVACGISPEQENEILDDTVGGWLTAGNTHEGAAEMFHKWAASR